MLAWMMAVFMLASAPVGEPSNDVEWRQLVSSASQRVLARDYYGAQKDLALANELAQRFGDRDPRRAHTAMRLGDIYLQFHSLPEARKQFEFAVPRFRDIQDSGFSSLAYCTHQLAEIDLREGKWKNAEERFNKAIHMYEQLGDRETQGLIASMFGLTRLYRTLQDVAKADAVMAETMRRTRTLPERPLTFGLMIAELAELAILHGNLPKADQHYKLALQESITRRGPIHREVAYILDRHADLLDRMKQRSNAAELRRKARSIRNQTL